MNTLIGLGRKIGQESREGGRRIVFVKDGRVREGEKDAKGGGS